ncbi:MAG: hypothetical protein BWY79_02079 [Actinobacteria bacterium ADurb.Bin444]|nr:MAG: hypothetical protein BWY79_02079 [Actinobacteria bacterium ADurb.Bin444]
MVTDKPSTAGEFDTLNTNQDRATSPAHMPMVDTAWPSQYIR